MSEVSIPVAPANRSDGGFFGLPLSVQERSKDGLLRAICLRAAFLSLLGYALYSALVVAALAVQMVPNQWENTYPEVPAIFAAIRAVLTGHLYRSFTEAPYVLQQYGPLYYELNAWIARIAHADVDRFIFLARATSLAAFFICGVLVFAICRRQKFSASVSLTAATLPMGVPFFCPWAVTVRPDMYFLALMLGSLALALWKELPTETVCISAGALGGLAFLMKQPGMAVLIAIGIAWLSHKKFRETLLLAAGALIPIAALLAILVIHKEPFLGQYLSIGKALRSVADARAYTWQLLNSPTRWLPIGIGALGLVPAFSTERGQMIVSFALVNWFVGVAGMPQLGAGSNYFLAGFLGCGLLLPFALEFVRKNMNFAPATLIIALGIGYLATGYSIGAVFNGVDMNPHPYQSLGQFHILSDRPGIALRGRAPDLLDPISIHTIELGGGNWSSKPIIQNVHNSAYDLVILACSRSRIVCNFRGVDFFAPAVVDQINANYSVFCTSGTGIVLTPRSRKINVTTDMLSPALGAACQTTYQGHAPDLIVLRGTR